MTTRRRALWLAIIFALVLTVLVVVGPFLVPVRPLGAATPLKKLAGPNSRFIDVPLAGDTLTMHYEEAGDGKPAFLLLHGFAASTFSWREVMPSLAKWGRTVAFDRPAFGLTERPLPETWQGQWKTQNPYTLDAQVDLTTGLMDQLGIDDAVLVGNSAGGTVAMLTALAYPERVKALILIDPSVYGGGGSSSPIVRWLLDTPQMQRLGPLVARLIESWGLDFARSAWHDPTKIGDDVLAGYQKPLQTADWDRALWEMTAASAPSGLPARLAELKLPVLVITGDDDRIVPTAQSVKLAKELPNAQLVVVPACGHVPQEECPQAVLQAMETFLAGLAYLRPGGLAAP
jgi:pimeloyl-ACP methyl ester carboxylesterase